MIANILLPLDSTALAAVCVTLLSCTTTLDPTVLVGDAPECSVFIGDASEYAICAEPLAFDLASNDCVRRGGALAAVGSAEEDDFIGTSTTGVASGNFWLGGRRDDTLVWSWPDGSVFWRGDQTGTAEASAYVRWQPGEPNDSSTVSTEPESCLALTQEGNDWNDRACSLTLPYVCEEPF
jgi:hypothetical protein